MRHAIILAVALSMSSCSDGDKPPLTYPEAGTPGAEAGTGAATGEPCKSGSECDGRVCLTDVVYAGQPTRFPDGYCTRKCPGKVECIAGESCVDFTDAAGSPIASYCLKTCTAPSCRTGYICTAAGLCMPR